MHFNGSVVRPVQCHYLKKKEEEKARSFLLSMVKFQQTLSGLMHAHNVATLSVIGPLDYAMANTYSLLPPRRFSVLRSEKHPS